MHFPFNTSVMIVIVGLFVYTMFKPNSHPELIKNIAGCYKGSGPTSAVTIHVNLNSYIVIGATSQKFSIRRDKIGVSILPMERIIFDHAVPNELSLISGTPLLLRIDNNFNHITVPDGATSILFERTKCT